MDYKIIIKTGGYIPVRVGRMEWEVDPRGVGRDVSASTYIALTWADIEQLYKIRCEYLASLADGAIAG